MSEKHTQPKPLWLADEFRPTMPREVMLLWGGDVVAELRRLHEANQDLLAALIQADSDFHLAGHDPDGLFRTPLRAAIAKAEGQQ